MLSGHGFKFDGRISLGQQPVDFAVGPAVYVMPEDTGRNSRHGTG
jgi:hypothetical protein